MNTIFLIVAGIAAIVILGLVMKVRKMPQYKIIKEKNSNGEEKWFVKTRKRLSYYYLEQTEDLPGFIDDTFATSTSQVAGQETQSLAEEMIINHRMTTVNGIEVEG